jgi:mannose-1-phosphate guanylyltransferase
MAEVAGRPFLEYLLGQLRAEGIAKATVCTGYMADAIASHFGDGAQWGVELRYSVEHEPLGTAGALKHAEPLLVGDRWVLMNGDSLFDISLRDLIARHAARPAPVTVALARVSDGHRYGRVILSADGTISAFAEKTDAATPGLINSGLYVIERQLLNQIPAGRAVSLERDVLPRLVGTSMHGAPFNGYFIDIGVPDDLLLARSDTEIFERLARRPARSPSQTARPQ